MDSLSLRPDTDVKETQTMRLINIIPHERDKNVKKMYHFLDWFCRRNKDTIKEQATEAIRMMTLYGEGVIFKGNSKIEFKIN